MSYDINNALKKPIDSGKRYPQKQKLMFQSLNFKCIYGRSFVKVFLSSVSRTENLYSNVKDTFKSKRAWNGFLVISFLFSFPKCNKVSLH